MDIVICEWIGNYCRALELFMRNFGYDTEDSKEIVRRVVSNLMRNLEQGFLGAIIESELITQEASGKVKWLTPSDEEIDNVRCTMEQANKRLAYCYNKLLTTLKGKYNCSNKYAECVVNVAVEGLMRNYLSGALALDDGEGIWLDQLKAWYKPGYDY